MLIIGGVTQGLKNKDIAMEVGTTEQVVKNYLRKIYDKLGVSDRLELALYSMHRRLLDGYVPPSFARLSSQAPNNNVPIRSPANGARHPCDGAGKKEQSLLSAINGVRCLAVARPSSACLHS